MGPTESDTQAVRAQLERVLSSPGFGRNERLSSFLRFVVERHLDGKNDELKETLIAIEVFGRKPDYDPKLDSIVRTEAIRLRARLAEYYTGEGRGDPIVIELPKGGYLPVFSPKERALETVASPASYSGARTQSRIAMRLLLALGLVAALGIAGLIGWVVGRRAAPITIAVLPLENLGHDPANDSFVDGLSAEIIRNLSAIDGLQVRSQTSSFAFRGKPRDVREAGKQLGVDYIVEGSILRASQQLRIDAQLVRVRDDSTVWSRRFDSGSSDVFAVQDQIALGIVNSLRLKLGAGRRRYETSAENYDLYLQARALQARAVSPNGTLGTVDLLEKVVAKDASFAPAYAALAAAYTARWADLLSEAPDEEWLQKTHAVSDRAIELDPLLPEAHVARAQVYGTEREWEQAEKTFRHAIELDPSNSESHRLFGNFLLTVGRTDEAVQQARAAVRMDPLSKHAYGSLTFMLLAAGRYDEAADDILKMAPDAGNRPQFLARVRLGQGRITEAIRLLEEDKNNPNKGFLGIAYARAGRRAEAEKLAADYPRPNIQVLIYAGLGDKDRTLEALDRMATRSVWRVGQYLTYPELALLRGDPRLKVFRHKIGLPS